jgi:hypothetical protein
MNNTGGFMKAKHWVLLFAILQVFFSSYVFAQGPPEGCISWWPGDGNANDVIGPNNGTLQGGTSFTQGRFGQAFYFDGIDDLVVATTKKMPTGKDDRTLEMWIKIDIRRNSEATFAGYGNPGGITEMFNIGARFRSRNLFFASGGLGHSSNGGVQLDLKSWYHVAVTNARGIITVYLNGVAVERPIIPIQTPAGGQFYIGGIPTSYGADRMLNGAVDEVRIYNRALSPSEISSIFNGGGGQGLNLLNVSVAAGLADQNVRTAGVQWVDYNNDGRQDLFFVGANGTAFFKNSNTGTFTKVISTAIAGRGASWADIDNDGRTDVIIANTIGAPTLLLNKSGAFNDISSSINPLGTSTQAAIWVDINRDQFIDLFLVNADGANQLFKQTGGSRFVDISGNAGVDFKGAGTSAVSSDFDGDGYQDIYVTNFKQPNKLYINNGNETFREIGAQAGVALNSGSVQVVVSDFNGDQRPDLFVVNKNGDPVLYKNLGNLKFSRFTGALRKAKKSNAAAAGDFDLNGTQDIVIQTGTANFLFTNDGKGNFKHESGISLNHSNSTTGVAVGDFNKDGKPDIAIGDGLFANENNSSNRSLSLILKGTHSNRSAIGATVVVQTGANSQAKEINAGNGNSEGAVTVHFGVGSATHVDFIQVKWPSGRTQVLQNVATNKIIKITEK